MKMIQKLTYVLLVLTVAFSCKKSDNVEPDVVKGLDGLILEELDTEGDFLVTAKLCKNGMAQVREMVTVDVFYFPAAANPTQAVKDIADPVEDENGEVDAQEIISQDQTFDVSANYIGGDKKVYTNYKVDQTFDFKVQANILCVVRVTDAITGTETYTTFVTKGSSLTTCLNL